MRDKEVPAKVDGEAAALQTRAKKPRLTEIQKLQSTVAEQKRTRGDSRTAAKSGKEKQGRAAEESGKALKEKPTKEKPAKEKTQGYKGQKGTENKVDDGGKKSRKASGGTVKVGKCLCCFFSSAGGGACWGSNSIPALSSTTPHN